jgi:hypothetical protein
VQLFERGGQKITGRHIHFAQFTAGQGGDESVNLGHVVNELIHRLGKFAIIRVVDVGYIEPGGDFALQEEGEFLYGLNHHGLV